MSCRILNRVAGTGVEFSDHRVRRLEEIVDRAGLAHELRIDGQAEIFAGLTS